MEGQRRFDPRPSTGLSRFLCDVLERWTTEGPLCPHSGRLIIKFAAPRTNGRSGEPALRQGQTWPTAAPGREPTLAAQMTNGPMGRSNIFETAVSQACARSEATSARQAQVAFSCLRTCFEYRETLWSYSAKVVSEMPSNFTNRMVSSSVGKLS